MGSIPIYNIRDIAIWGFQTRAQFIDYLFADGKPKSGSLIAINAEKVMTAEEDQTLRAVIDTAEYKYADGISIVKSIRRKYPEAQIERIAGADLWEGLMERAGKEGIPVFLVGGTNSTLSATEVKLKQRWNVEVVGRQDGYFEPDQRQMLFDEIRRTGAKIVTVAMGSPRQELFIRDCRSVYPEALYMGVGGTYDVFIGRVKRAPQVWQSLGLEWLYRLLTQPTRWRRQVKLMKYAIYHIMGRL